MKLIACLAAAALFVIPRGAAANDRGPYRFLAGDVIQISVPSHQGWDKTVTVQPDGCIHYPLAGEIHAAGMTVAELEGRIRTALEAQLEQPTVTVGLSSTHEGLGWVTVLGAVGSAGRFEPKANWTLSEALAAAGIKPESDLSRVELVRDGKMVRKLDLSKLKTAGTLEEVIPVQSGDLIIVPETPRTTISVLGQVGKPGIVEWQKGMTILEALNQAGGAGPKADLKKAAIARAGATEPEPVDLDALVRGNNRLNLEMHPGDSLIVPENPLQVYVLGRVVRPSAYPLTRDEHVLDILVTAGGPAPDASLDGARLLRMGPDRKPQLININLDRMMNKGDLRGNLALKPEDIVILPQKGRHRSVNDYLNWIWPVNSLYTLYQRFFGR